MNRVSQYVENELKAMKEEARKKEAATKEKAKRPKETTKDMVGRWMKNGGQGCSKYAAK
jgi:hypothetical protein